MKPVPAIKLQDDFQHFIDEFEVSYKDYNLAEATWIKAEEAIYGNSHYVQNNHSLSQAELQCLTTMNSYYIYNIERCIYWDKMQVDKLWVSCDVNDKTTTEKFINMKMYQNRIDKLKKELKFLVGIQKKLKHQRDNS